MLFRSTLADFGESGKWSALTRTKRNEIAAHYLIGTGVLPAFGMLHFPVVNPKTEKLNEMIEKCKQGPLQSEIKEVEQEEINHQGFNSFKILSG